MWKWIVCFFLGHNWEKIDKEVQHPLLEKILENPRVEMMRGYDKKWAEGAVVWLVRCPRCTRIKTITEDL